MSIRAIALIILFPHTAFLFSGQLPTSKLIEQLPDKTALSKPGVYPLKDGYLLGVGQAMLHSALRDSLTSRTALNLAERDAKRRIARHLYPEVFANHQNVSVNIRLAQRVHEQMSVNNAQVAYVAIVVNEKDVTVIPLPDTSVILDAKKVFIPPEMLYYLQDPLLQLGGGRVFSYEEGWIIIGVGVAPLFGDDSIAERDAMKRARIDAAKAITEAVFGSNFQMLEQEAENSLERDGVISIRKWSQRRTRESIEGELNNAVEVGYWLTDDEHIAVVMAASDIPLNHSTYSMTEQTIEETGIADYPDWEVEPQWEYPLLAHPRLLKGGAIVYPNSETLWVVGVGAAKLTGNLANDRINAPRAAQMDASRHIIRYLVGFSSHSHIHNIVEVEKIWDENGLESSSIIESLKKITKENATGMVRELRSIGTWKSQDCNLLYQAYVMPFKITDR